MMDQLTAAYLQNLQQLGNIGPIKKKKRRSYKVYIGGLPPDATSDESFVFFGNLKRIWIARKPPGFAYAFYESLHEAQQAVNEMNGKILCGQVIKVEIAYEDLPQVINDQKQQLFTAQLQALTDMSGQMVAAHTGFMPGLSMPSNTFQMISPTVMPTLSTPYVREVMANEKTPPPVPPPPPPPPRAYNQRQTRSTEWWEEKTSSSISAAPYPKPQFRGHQPYRNDFNQQRSSTSLALLGSQNNTQRTPYVNGGIFFQSPDQPSRTPTPSSKMSSDEMQISRNSMGPSRTPTPDLFTTHSGTP
ncbi:unnamed protein product, partial [Mesorhabditis belari]|uniref:RRM domain-containing protein n=1 Tax=Mesorhabditis belari TaxID=2138241 RepID=A0AAF3EQ78_9BILA